MNGASGDDSVPQRIGRYEIQRELGRGGMGVVYAAHDPRLGRSVALKLLPEVLFRDDRRRGRFEREAQLLARVHHPNVATIFTLEEDSDHTFLTMELVSGQSLAERLQDGPLSLEVALPLLRQVASGVEAAHAEGVIHRDLKPGNILVDESGRARVLDFGIATTLRASAGEVTQGLTQEAAIGTPGYMSPEQLRGDTVDERSDIWSFAAVAAEMLSGAPIVEGQSAADRVAATLLREPSFHGLPESVPPAIRTLLAACLAKSPAERPESMTVVRRTIESLLAVRSERGRPQNDPEAPGSSLSVIPGNLPTPLSSFVGRSDELKWIDDRLSTHSLVTLVGVGGGGKTRLAIESARAARDRFVGGVWLVELAPVREPSMVAKAVAQVVGVREDPGQPLSEVIAHRLHDTEALLVLDNCEHVIDAAAELVRELLQAAGGLRVLATSREALGLQAESIVPVAPLELPKAETMEARLASAAVQLFLARVRQHRPDFEETAGAVEAAVRICSRLDGLPLALELAAARANLLSLPAIEARLNDRFRLLRRGSREASAHHQTLDALIAWSYDLLEPAEQRFFRQLSVFSGGCTLEAAEFVCADEEVRGWDVLDFLTQLVEKSLVETRMSRASDFEEVRYAYLESIREFAGARLQESGQGEVDAVHLRQAEWACSLALQASDHYQGREEAEWLERLESEHFNFRAVLSYCLSARKLDMALQIVRCLIRYWEVRGHWLEGLNFCTELLDLTGAMPPSYDLAGVLNGAGNLAAAADRYVFAEKMYGRALEAWTQLGNEKGMAGALNNLCMVGQRARDSAQAQRYGERALAINRRIGNRAWEATNLLNLGLINDAQGRYVEAREQYEAALDISSELGDLLVVSGCLANLGNIADSMGDLDAAADYYERSLQVRRDLGDRRGESISLGNLGVLEARRGQLTEARRLLEESLRLKVDGGYLRGQVYSVESFASLELEEGRFEVAARLLGAAEAARASLGAPLSQSEIEEREPGFRRIVEALGTERRDELLEAGRQGGLEQAIRSILADSDEDTGRD